MVNRQRTQHQSIHHTEYQRIYAYAQRKRDNGYQCESGISCEHTQCVGNVAAKMIKPQPAAGFIELFLSRRTLPNSRWAEASESERLVACVVSAELVRFQRDVGFHFGLKISVFAAASPEHI